MTTFNYNSYSQLNLKYWPGIEIPFKTKKKTKPGRLMMH